MRADDALKYAAARLHSCTDWAIDSIAGSICEGADGHEVELEAIADIVAAVNGIAAGFGNRLVYSDGRLVRSTKEIQYGRTTERIWHPDVALDEVTSWRGDLPSDPGVPSPGRYEVTCYPVTQEMHVRVVKSVNA